MKRGRKREIERRREGDRDRLNVHVGGTDTTVMFQVVCMTSWELCINGGFRAVKVIVGYAKMDPI